jgi:hypothetical protein
MLGAAIDKNDIVICPKIPAQVSGRNYPAAASAKDHNPFSFRRESHVAESGDALEVIFWP